MFKNKFKKWLERLAKVNETQFGKGQRLECCQLNRKTDYTNKK